MLATADVAILVDRGGVVRDLLFRDLALSGELARPERWLGRRWRSTVTVESRPKLDALLAGADAGQPIRWRHLNHPARSSGPDVAMAYSAVPVGGDGAKVVLGRDLRDSAALQQRLVEAQRALEREYDGLRDAEARFRLLFEHDRDALVLLDARTTRVSELNPTARALLDANRRRSAAPFPELFDSPDRDALRVLLDRVRNDGGEEETAMSLGGERVRVAVAALNGEAEPLLLARFWPEAASVPARSAALPALLELMPDAVVLCDADGDVVALNAAFRAMAELPPRLDGRGEPLSRWVGAEPVDLDVLLDNLRRHGSVRGFNTALRPEYGGRRQVEIAAMRTDGPPAGFALFIRDVSRRPAAPTTAAGSAGERMKALIGRVSLKDLVRDSTDAIERLCIESALEMTNNNRASAAEMLGLSRQSLYVKLRRYGLGGGEDGAEPDAEAEPDGDDTTRRNGARGR
ncbi:MAG: transcriptional regulator PpsR [Gluconacetobacter diazotrophicus]|nr:transcriptional regulator PpsR [Gluconacetobacter diazotrophicus]